MTDEFIGKSLGRYHVLEQLGRGGMAVVYKAYDTKLDRYVAVKVILPYQEHSGQFLARFTREARTLAKLTHPNILKIFDYGEHENNPFLVMEYIAGGTLIDKLTGSPISWQESAQLLVPVARALEAAHAQGVIHRDVKPTNILMANGRDPMLSDFGIAKIIEGAREITSLTETGVGIGTPDYMAPEQADGFADERSDVYALGVIYYQMVTGRLPYEADTPLAVMFKKITDPLPRPTHFVSELPAFVENVLIKALAKDPEYRYSSMREFAESLEMLAGGADPFETSVTEPGTDLNSADGVPVFAPLDSSAGGNSKRLSPWVISAGILVAALLFGAYLWRMSPAAGGSNNGEPSPETAIAETPLELPPSVTAEPEFPPPPAPTPIPVATPTAAGGEWIAFNSRMDGDADIYLMDLDGGNLTQITSSSAHDLYPSWSPDGKRIVYQTNDGDQEITIIDISSKKVTMVTGNDCNDWAPVWSPDGNWLAFYSDCDGDRNIYKIRPDGTKRTRLTLTSGSNSWFPAWSPDGKRLTFTSNRSGTYHIYVMNADGSNIRELAEGCISAFSPDGQRMVYGVYCDDTDDLFLMDADGSNPTALTDGYECRNATWSPDGTQIVFQLSKTTKDGPFALYRMYLDRPDREDWVLLADFDVNGGSPAWQP